MPTVIANPILNRPYAEPTRHFRFDDDGITDQIVESRRPSEYFVPIARPKKKGAGQLRLDAESMTEDRREENRLVNDIRRQVAVWRQGGYVGVTPTTRQLLAHWTDESRDRRLFFCQIEALETVVYITEVAGKYGDAWIANRLAEANDSSNPGLSRMALKMATGSGKTVVMAMLIAYNTLNKIDNPMDIRFSDAFLVVTPGITIKDRLRVLLPNDPGNDYRELDIVPVHLRERLDRAKIIVTNYHAFQPREKVASTKLTKQILDTAASGAFTETPAEVANRVCREFGPKGKSKSGVIVLNDEAHHCYRRRPEPELEVMTEKLTGDDLSEAKQRDAEARVWISGVEAVKAKLGLRRVYDLSATPFFLKGSGYREGTLFPWVVSDFSLIDAIESGIVKIPRVPVSDNAMGGDLPTNRDLWTRIRDGLPKKGGKTQKITGEPKLPMELEGALQSLYSHYEQTYRRWESDPANRAQGQTPPVFIVVCNNTNVSKMVYDYVSGWDRSLDPEAQAALGRERQVVAGRLDLFRNDDGAGGWSHPPRTILVDSVELESGAMSPEFKALATREIEEFKADYRRRFPGRTGDDIADVDLLREVMNTVGKPGRLGEHVRCVVSVSMLTEGWDANTVTHILGVRAFGTQLLCEQVVGRALRRMSYAVNDDGYFAPEYAEVFGVPFSFIPSTGDKTPPTRSQTTRIKALESRIAAEITFPRVTAYRYEVRERRLSPHFTDDSQMALTPQDVPTRTENSPAIGESVTIDLDDLRLERMSYVTFKLAERVLKSYFPDDSGGHKHWLFPQLLTATRAWVDGYVTCKDEAIPQMLMIAELQHTAAAKIFAAIVRGDGAAHGRASDSPPPTLLPVLQPYDTLGSTRYVAFDTTKPVYETDPAKCHLNYVVADTDTWEQKMAETLERLPQVLRYVKNQGLGFTIPYTLAGDERQYTPDYLIHLDDGHGPADPLNLILEVSGQNRPDKTIKAETARDLWVPAINNHGGYGRWAYTNIIDPWESEGQILARTLPETN